MTHGHPLALKLVTDALQAARIQERELLPHKIWEEPVSSNPMHIADYEQKTVEAYLLSVLLYQLSIDEQEQLVDLAAPRTLDLATLKFLLDLSDEKKAAGFWKRYSTLCFLRFYDSHTISFHPLVRNLLNRRLIAQSSAHKDYYKITHRKLREYFSELATASSSQEQIYKASIEEAYHALALGELEPAIALLCYALTQKDTRWQDMLNTIIQAPTVCIPTEAEQQAAQALLAARNGFAAMEPQQQRREAVTALVLYSWLLTMPENSIEQRIEFWYALSETYHCLPAPDRQTCLQISEGYLEHAHEAEMEQTPLLDNLPSLSPPNMEPFPVHKKRRILHTIRIAASILLVASLLISYLTLYYGNYARSSCNPSSLLSPQRVLNSTIFSHGIGMTHASDGECIGISDGPTPFDPDHPDPAEALIYHEDARVLGLWKQDPHRYPYVTVVLLTTVTSRPEDVQSAAKGRADLQGAYIAQIEHNKLWFNPLLRILIANTGGNSQYAEQVASQVVDAAHHDPTIVAVLGPTQSRAATFKAVRILTDAHIPVISGTATGDEFTDFSPYFLRVAPPNKAQVNVAVAYAEQQWHSKRAVIFEDPNDYYSENLSEDFRAQFQQRDHHLIVADEQYNANDTDVSDKITSAIHDACQHHPDLIYFTGRSDAMSRLIQTINSCGDVKIMGADTLDLFASSANTKYTSYPYNIYYTSIGSPMQWEGYSNIPHEFTSFLIDYSQYPNSSDLNGQIMLSYDAANTLSEAIIAAEIARPGRHLQREDLLHELKAMHGSKAIQGISGVIDFGPDGDPVNKVVILLEIDKQGTVHVVPGTIKGRMLKTP